VSDGRGVEDGSWWRVSGRVCVCLCIDVCQKRSPGRNHQIVELGTYVHKHRDRDPDRQRHDTYMCVCVCDT